MEQNEWDDLLSRMIEDLVPLLETRPVDRVENQLSDPMASRILKRTAARIAAAEEDGLSAAYPGTHLARSGNSGSRRNRETVTSQRSRSTKQRVRLGIEELERRNSPCGLYSFDAGTFHDSYTTAESFDPAPAFASSELVGAGVSEALAVLW